MIKKTIAALPLMLFMLMPRTLAMEVIPSGECVGVKLYTGGTVVVESLAVTDKEGRQIDVAAGYGIKKGDILTKINSEPITSNRMLAQSIAENGANPIRLTLRRNGTEHELTVMPADTADGPKLGLWLRDSTAGLGTITCYSGRNFAALGHGICDIDTGTIMPVGHGIIQRCSSVSIRKGSNGLPGSITGMIDGTKLGQITGNADNGLFGTLAQEPTGTPVPVAKAEEVKTGAAKILADVDGGGVKEYSIEIKRVSPPLFGNKDMIIKVTDKALIEKTGGIVQGMSGAPILQNGRLVGAVTHVFVNDPTSGYAILAEHLLAR